MEVLMSQTEWPKTSGYIGSVNHIDGNSCYKEYLKEISLNLLVMQLNRIYEDEVDGMYWVRFGKARIKMGLNPFLPRGT